MSNEFKQNDQELWSQIQEQFQKLVKETGVDLNMEYQEEIAEALGINVEDFEKIERETIKALTTKTLKIKKINSDAVIPKYSYPSDSGFDLHSVEAIVVPPLSRVLVPTGIKVEFDDGLELQIRPKSGLAINDGITVLNTPGTVDSGYNGEIKVIIFNTNIDLNYEIKKGQKIAQGVLCPVINGRYVNIQEVEELGEKDRGENGFGSTGI
jgi:dUTP pyrophosphatase